MRNNIILILAVLVLVACGTHKSAVTTPVDSTPTAITKQDNIKYIQRIAQNAVGADNIVSRIDFSIVALGQDFSVDGKLQMRRDKMIRITLSPLGLMEVGRLEFTPEDVLLVNRMDKQYVRAKYTDLDFLRNNNLDFYALQSLFWNELYLPGTGTATADNSTAFDVTTAGREVTIAHTTGKFAFSWKALTPDYNITTTSIDYAKGTTDSSSVQWAYGSFANVNGKKFPTSHTITVDTNLKNARKMSVSIKMSKPTTDSNWDLKTSISSKYKQVEASDILQKLLNTH